VPQFLASILQNFILHIVILILVPQFLASILQNLNNIKFPSKGLFDSRVLEGRGGEIFNLKVFGSIFKEGGERRGANLIVLSKLSLYINLKSKYYPFFF